MPQAAAGLALEAVSAAPRALGKARKRGRIVRQRITALRGAHGFPIARESLLNQLALADALTWRRA